MRNTSYLQCFPSQISFHVPQTLFCYSLLRVSFLVMLFLFARIILYSSLCVFTFPVLSPEAYSLFLLSDRPPFIIAFCNLIYSFFFRNICISFASRYLSCHRLSLLQLYNITGALFVLFFVSGFADK